MSASRLLVSHALCPYVQRVAIVLAEKRLPFERREVDLARKPAWFLAVSPLGKTPVLVVDGRPIFESAVICEYLDETEAPRLHPEDPLERARHRAWMAYGSTVLDAIAALYNAPDEEAISRRERALHGLFEQLEGELRATPFFAGPAFSLVDAVFAPVFRYFDTLERLGIDVFGGLPKVRRWRRELAQRPSVIGAVGDDYGARLASFIDGRNSALSRRAADLRERA